ncbi:type VI secretion system protein TssL, long form [Aurantivibrio infirmus]
MEYEDNTVIKPRPGGRTSSPRGNPDSNSDLSDQTVIKPRPRPGGNKTSPQTFSDGADNTVIKPRKARTLNIMLNLKAPNSAEVLKQSPLIDAASSLLSLTPQLRQLDGKVDIYSLRQHVTQLISRFQLQLKTVIEDLEVRSNASYVVCSLIDETVLNTPWGENSAWSQKPMLSQFHQETYGGEKVYAILDNAMLSPTLYYELIELIYLSLSLGFLGKLRIDPQGAVKAEQIRSRIYDVLNQSRERYQRELSIHTKPANSLKNRLHSFLPLWLFVATLTLAAFGIFNYLLIDLNKRSDLSRDQLVNLIPVQEETKLPENRSRQEAITLRRLLSDEIDRGILSVDDYRTHTSIVLHSNELFDSGSTDIDQAFFPVLDKIAKALEAIPGRIIVSGHTDNLAIRTPRFPSNWHLSLARASAVVRYIDEAAALQARLLPEGKGESLPLADNSTVEGRAKNRRVVIDIFHENNSLL